MTSSNDRERARAAALSAIDSYGARVEAWPEAARAALGDVRGEPDVARALEAAAALDRALDAAPTHGPSADLRARLLASAPKPGAAPAPGFADALLSLLERFGLRTPAAGALSASAALGLVVGVWTAVSVTGSLEDSPEAQLAALTAPSAYQWVIDGSEP